MSRGRLRAIALASYLLLVIGLISGLFVARRWAETSYSDKTAQTEWQSYRDDVARQSLEGGPVRRRIPQSGEPPALVLMRDYFVVVTVIAVVLTSALYGTLVFFVGGVLLTPRREDDSDEPREYERQD